MNMTNYRRIITGFVVIICFFSACKTDEIFENPYAGGKQPLAITFNNATAIEPLQGGAGDVVTMTIPGASEYKDKLMFKFNGETADNIVINGSTVTVKVPVTGSTGATSVQIGDQVFFGPQFKVLGKVKPNPYFKGQTGADFGIYGSMKLQSGQYILVGDFTNFNAKGAILPINSIVTVTEEAEVTRPLQFGTGATGYLNSVVASPGQASFFIAGAFNTFDRKGNIKTITRLKSNGALDSVQVNFYSTIHGGKPKRGVPVFNGGTDRPIEKLFYFNNRVIAVGDFKYYLKNRYDVGRTYTDRAGQTLHKDSVATDSISANQLISFKPENGDLDDTYHFKNGITLEGGNGSIIDAYMQPDGKLIIVGNFNKFDNVPAGGIVRLKTDGTVDETFNAGVGANGPISSITWSQESQRFVITGSFGSYNQQLYSNLALLNADGSLDPSFKAGNFDNGFPSYAKQLSNGLIVVSGGFRKYNGVKRTGFMILNTQAQLAPGYNALGEFSGYLTNIIEHRNQEDKRSLLLMGVFRKFDSQPASNIAGIILED